MKISPVCNSLNFCSKSKEVKKADDIQRRTRQVFPAISNTYIDNNYLSAKSKNKHSYWVYQLNMHLLEIILSYRRRLNQTCIRENFSNSDFHFNTLAILKNYKIGNCSEMCSAAGAALCANGYCNTKVASLYYQVSLLDKQTHEPKEERKGVIDHNVVVTDMNTGGEKNILVDPWLGFAATKQEANAKYKIFFEERCNSIKQSALYSFGDYDKSKYIVNSCFVYHNEDSESILEKQKLGEKTKKDYPELVI